MYTAISVHIINADHYVSIQHGKFLSHRYQIKEIGEENATLHHLQHQLPAQPPVERPHRPRTCLKRAQGPLQAAQGPNAQAVTERASRRPDQGQATSMGSTVPIVERGTGRWTKKVWRRKLEVIDLLHVSLHTLIYKRQENKQRRGNPGERKRRENQCSLLLFFNSLLLDLFRCVQSYTHTLEQRYPENAHRPVIGPYTSVRHS